MAYWIGIYHLNGMKERGVPQYGITPFIDRGWSQLDGGQRAERPAQIVPTSTSFRGSQFDRNASDPQFPDQCFT